MYGFLAILLAPRIDTAAYPTVDLHGDIYRSSRNSEVAVCLIPDTYVGMHSPVLGPAVLHRDVEVANF